MVVPGRYPTGSRGAVSRVALGFFPEFDDWPGDRPPDDLDLPFLFLTGGTAEEDEDVRARAGAAFFLPARLFCALFLPPALDEALPLAGVRLAEEVEAPVSVVDDERPLPPISSLGHPLGGGSASWSPFRRRPPDIRNAICWRSVILEKSMDPSSLRGRSADDEGGRSSREPRDESRGILPGLRYEREEASLMAHVHSVSVTGDTAYTNTLKHF